MTNLLRGEGPETLLGHPKPGDKPHPIRKKAFHRALKRGDLWAIVPYSHMASDGSLLTLGPNKFAKVIPDVHCPSGVIYCMWPLYIK